jgi:hypothetical protein
MQRIIDKFPNVLEADPGSPAWKTSARGAQAAITEPQTLLRANLMSGVPLIRDEEGTSLQTTWTKVLAGIL